VLRRPAARTAYSLSCPADAGHPVRRGLSGQRLMSLEYWIAPVKPGDDVEG